MQKTTNDTIGVWQEEGGEIVPRHFEVFRRLVDRAQDLVRREKFDAAAVYAEMAAFYATGKHCGLFFSPELESILLTIGEKSVPASLAPAKNHSDKPSKHVLHVATSVKGIGGLTKMMWRWMQQDKDRCHSLAITQQDWAEVPQILRDTIAERHGQIYILNDSIGEFDSIAKAKRLREIAAAADWVVLHTYNYDVVPLIAFANKEQSPPVLLLDHADHLFWLGTSISDAVIALRESGKRLALERRDINSERSVLLPIILELSSRKLTRAEAKRQIGIPENSVLLLSIARSLKYKTIDGISFADAHVPLLQQHDNAYLVVVGSGDREDWQAAIEQTNGRIISYPEREDTALFYQAADIYLDSFPFISTTSLLEAGSYELPLVTRFPYSEDSIILGADMPGLSGNLIRTQDLEAYTTVLSRLVEDEEFRRSLGEATRQKIAETHTGSYWQNCLEQIYACATTIPRITARSYPRDRMFVGEPDIFIPHIHGWDDNFIDSAIQARLPVIPFTYRLRPWFDLVKKYGLQHKIMLLMPDGVRSIYVDLKATFKKHFLSRISEVWKSKF
jgi:glycosyltransferase involved in cell wall biosynthesis